jgi:hypothetical protein
MGGKLAAPVINAILSMYRIGSFKEHDGTGEAAQISTWLIPQIRNSLRTGEKNSS